MFRLTASPGCLIKHVAPNIREPGRPRNFAVGALGQRNIIQCGLYIVLEYLRRAGMGKDLIDPRPAMTAPARNGFMMAVSAKPLIGCLFDSCQGRLHKHRVTFWGIPKECS